MTLKTLAWLGVALLAGLAMAASLAYLNRWQVVFFALIPWLVIPVSLGFAFIGLAMQRRVKVGTSSRLHTFGNILLLLSLVLGLQLVAPAVARTFWDWEIQRAQTFLGTLIPGLEEYKRQYGDYPKTLAPLLTPDTPLPALLQLQGASPFAFDNRNFYRQYSLTYGFEFYAPDGFIGYQYHYCCGADGTWTITD